MLGSTRFDNLIFRRFSSDNMKRLQTEWRVLLVLLKWRRRQVDSKSGFLHLNVWIFGESIVDFYKICIKIRWFMSWVGKFFHSSWFSTLKSMKSSKLVWKMRLIRTSMSPAATVKAHKWTYYLNDMEEKLSLKNLKISGIESELSNKIVFKVKELSLTCYLPWTSISSRLWQFRHFLSSFTIQNSISSSMHTFILLIHIGNQFPHPNEPQSTRFSNKVVGLSSCNTIIPKSRC